MRSELTKRARELLRAHQERVETLIAGAVAYALGARFVLGFRDPGCDRVLVARARDRGLSWVIAMNSPEPDELNRAVQLSAIEGLELRIWVPHRRRSFHKYIIAGDGQAYRIDSFLRARRRHGRMTAAIAERLICPVSHRAFFRYSDSLRARSRAVDPDEVAQWHDILQEWERAAAERRAMGLDDDDYFT